MCMPLLSPASGIIQFLMSEGQAMQIWVPSNPRGAEILPPAVVAAESDFYLRRLWGTPSEIHKACAEAWVGNFPAWFGAQLRVNIADDKEEMIAKLTSNEIEAKFGKTK
ncbi:unnamed protein product [Camellia sinensis]